MLGVASLLPELELPSERLALEAAVSGLLPWTDSLRMRVSGASQVRVRAPASMSNGWHFCPERRQKS